MSTAEQIAEKARQADHHLVIEPKKGWSALRLKEVWQYRELLYFLTWRDILVRYKQAVLGIAWAILQPVLTMVVFTAIFNSLLNVGTGSYDVPYPLFAYAGLLPWQLFSGSLSRSGTSLVGNASLLTKVYFPRLVIPTSAVLAGLVDFVISFVVLGVLMVVYGEAPTWHVVLLPFLILMTMMTALAVSLWLSALNVLYRDVQYLIPFMIQLWMYVSPVMYPIDRIPEGPIRVLYNLNPMTGVIGGFRWALFGQQQPSGLFWVSVGAVVVIFVSGLYYFKRMERTFADVV